MFLGFCGFFFDLAIDNLVIQMGEYVRDGGTGKVINEVWGIVRDFGNLIFIFGFIYIGICTILQPESANTKRFLAQLIIAALLINFSLFFTKVVIDVANVFAIETYALLRIDDDGGIGWGIAKQAGLAGFYNTLEPGVLAQTDWGGGFSFYIMGALFLMITAFVLLGGAVMIVIRYVALIFIMIFSPLLFALLVFPQTQKYAKELGVKLLSYSFFAPIFLFLIYVSLSVLNATNFGGGTNLNGAMTNLANKESGSFEIILQFAVAIIFLVLSLQAAKHLSIRGGEQFVKAGQALRNRGQRILGSSTLGVAAGLGRGTVGRLGYLTTQSSKLHREMEKGGARGFMARMALRSGKTVSERSFDARRVAGVGKNLGIGEGKKGGYAQSLKEREKRDQEYMDMISDNVQIYKDRGVEPEFNLYKQKIEERKEKLQRLAQDTDTAQRGILTDEILAIDTQIKDMENAGTIKWEEDSTKRSKWTENLTEADWKKMQQFSAARKIAHNLPREEFAASVERRGTQLWPGLRHIYNFTINDTTKNKQSAASLRKNLNKSSNDKLVDAIKGIKVGGTDA